MVQTPPTKVAEPLVVKTPAATSDSVNVAVIVWVGLGLTVLAGYDLRELVDVRFDDIPVAKKNARALGGRGRGPRWKSGLCRRHDLAHFVGAGVGRMGDHLSGRGIVDIAEAVLSPGTRSPSTKWYRAAGA